MDKTLTEQEIALLRRKLDLLLRTDSCWWRVRLIQTVLFVT